MVISMVKNARFKKGETVLWGGVKYKVSSVSYITHPEHLIGGEKYQKPGWIYQLSPAERGAEEPSGWIRQGRLKRIQKRKISKLT